MSACWPESCRGCSYPGTVWGRLEDTDFKLLTVFTHITSKRGLKESTFIAGLDSFNTHSQSCPASALLTSCGYSSCRRALAGWRGPAVARSCTRPGPRAGPCSEQRCCCPHCFPLSSASQHGSYSGPVLKHQQTAIIFLLIGAPTDLPFFHNLKLPGLSIDLFRSFWHRWKLTYLCTSTSKQCFGTELQYMQFVTLQRCSRGSSVWECAFSHKPYLTGKHHALLLWSICLQTFRILYYRIKKQQENKNISYILIQNLEMSLAVFLHTRQISVLLQWRDTFRYLLHVHPCCSWL